DLRVVVTSASIEAERFATFFSEGLAAPVPVLHVSGRQYPVAIEYRDPGDEELGYLDASIRAIRELPGEGETGDVLCFLPTERDILEARRRLRDEPGSTVLPLFGRLSPHEQKAIFQPQRGRKVVLATNIAETSVTVPGIRVVIDAGLARMKRYQAQSRTERLPIEPVAQASCLQRAGRAGRLAPGRCIRLFGEQDYQRRPAYTDPEILRSNLAGVLLQCLDMGLGDPAEMPWLDAPRPGAWQQARQLLLELGALSSAASGSRLTSTGRRMAALPCDPGVARMLLLGADAGVAAEVATIAAFCSVQEPRVRPSGEEAKADAAHAAFRHEAGDLATVLQLWQAWQDCGSTAAQGRFSRSHYLGFRRMREWADVRHQFLVLLREQRLARKESAPADWNLDAIHRAVLGGCLGNVMQYDAEKRCYRSGDRQIVVHPGSALAPRNRQEKQQHGGRYPWLMAVEVVETTRLFARLCAPIDPSWVVELAGELCRRRYGDPFYHTKRGAVVCEERVFWRGLAVQERRLVPAEPIDAAAAHETFIREALADGRLGARIRVVRDNRRLLRRVQGLVERLRDGSLYVDDQALADCYRERLRDSGICDDRQLRRWLTKHGDQALAIRPGELVDPEAWSRAEAGFPMRVELAGRDVPLRYRYAPGDAEDGARIELTPAEFESLDPQRLTGLIPGWLPEQVQVLLKSLPKQQRRLLIPIADNAQRLADRLSTSKLTLCEGLAALLDEEFGLRTRFDPALLPDHVRPLVILVDEQGTELARGRDLEALGGGRAHDPLIRLRQRHESPPLEHWPELPDQVAEGGHQAWAGLLRCRAADAGVSARVQLYAHRGARDRWHADGVLALLERRLDPELEQIAQQDGRARGLAKLLKEYGGLPALRRSPI
ncbi:MAG: DUF3418 domain-containing protein, partial [Planctomycetota bacterium]